MEIANKRLVLRWFTEVWNERFPNAIDEMFHPNGVVHAHDDPRWDVKGREGLKAGAQKFMEAFPDMRIEVEQMVAEDDRVAARCRLNATHLGEGLGVAPTGKKVSITGAAIFRMEDGMLVEAWNNFDIPGLFQQIGVPQVRG